MNKELIGIIVCLLFVGVSLSSAISIDTRQSIINKASEEECWDCKYVDTKYLVILQKQLSGIEVYLNLLLILSRYNPEFKEEVQELSNEILTIIEIYDKIETYLSNNDKPICDGLYNAHSKIYDIWDVLDELYDKFKDIKILNQILEIIFYLTGVYGVVFVIIGILFNCEWTDEWPWTP